MATALKKDPSRTAVLRRRFVADMNRRFKKLSREIEKLIVTDDAFGLNENAPFTFSKGIEKRKFVLATNIERQAWRFQTDAQKVRSYRRWLQGEIDAGILTVDGLGNPWTNTYVQSAHRKGFARSYGEVKKLEGGFFTGTKDQFLQEAFNAPVIQSKLELIYTRTFSGLQDITTSMSQQMSRILVDGLSAGQGPTVIARQLRNNLAKINRTRSLVLARTEVIHAHAEGQLDSFERLDVDEVDVFAEWSTAGDDLVCPLCAPLEGAIMTIKEARGTLPRHPNCRCAWKPAEKQKGRRKKTQAKIDDSIQAERPNKPLKEARRQSTWLGK